MCDADWQRAQSALVGARADCPDADLLSDRADLEPIERSAWLLMMEAESRVARCESAYLAARATLDQLLTQLDRIMSPGMGLLPGVDQ